MELLAVYFGGHYIFEATTIVVLSVKPECHFPSLELGKQIPVTFIFTRANCHSKALSFLLTFDLHIGEL